jgi:cobalt/nickel transport protein
VVGVKLRKAYLVVALLLAASPLFLVLSDMVGYHEPLDLAAELLGLKDVSEEVNWTPFFDYTVPGLPPALGYVVAGAVGTALVVLLSKVLQRMVK